MMRRFFFVLVTLVILLSFVQPVAAGSPVRVYYAGPEKNSVYTALTLATKGPFTFVTDPAQADVFVLNGVITDPAIITLQSHNNAVSLTNLPLKDPLVQQIIWNGAPQVRERSDILTPISSGQPLVTTYEDGAWILWSAHKGKANPSYRRSGLLGQ